MANSKRGTGKGKRRQTRGRDAASASDKSSYATRVELRALLEQQGYKCALTGRDLDPKTAHVDHVVPIHAGGGSGVDNLQWLDKAVNRAKGTMSLAEFWAMCCDVVRHLGDA